MKKLMISMFCLVVLLSFTGCSVTSTQTDESSYEQEKFEEVEETEEVVEEIVEETHEPLAIGGVVTSDDWNIKLTNAYTTLKLESSESRTAWDANDGYAFLILEFDVTCLNSTKPTVDGEGITEIVANAGGNTYASWEYQYVNSEIWCYIRNNYLEANLPLHIYVYTMIPRDSMNSSVSVELKIAGQPKVITVN